MSENKFWVGPTKTEAKKPVLCVPHSTATAPGWIGEVQCGNKKPVQCVFNVFKPEDALIAAYHTFGYEGVNLVIVRDWFGGGEIYRHQAPSRSKP